MISHDDNLFVWFRFRYGLDTPQGGPVEGDSAGQASFSHPLMRTFHERSDAQWPHAIPCARSAGPNLETAHLVGDNTLPLAGWLVAIGAPRGRSGVPPRKPPGTAPQTPTNGQHYIIIFVVFDDFKKMI